MSKSRSNKPVDRSSPGGTGGRKRVNPWDLEPILDRYLAQAKERGLTECPLDRKSVALQIGCSHTHLSPSAIDRTPPEYRAGWLQLREKIDAAASDLSGRRKSETERLRSEVAALRTELEARQQETELLWAWMIQIETGLMHSGINTELFMPDDLRYPVEQRRQTASD